MIKLLNLILLHLKSRRSRLKPSFRLFFFTPLMLPLLPMLSFGQENKKFVVKGKIDTVPFAQYEVCYKVTFDSIVIQTLTLDENSEFELVGAIPEPAAVELRYYLSDRDRVAPYLFWVEPNKVMEFHGKGSKGAGAINNYTLTNAETDVVRARHDSLWMSNKHLDVEDLNILIKKFITDNFTNYYGLNLLWKQLRNEKPDYLFVDSTFAKIPSALKETHLAKDIQRKRALVIGATLPDFIQPDADGKLVKVSHFRGKYLLVDFWASWCQPCRAENPALVEAYAEYREKGFEILGVSLDDDRRKWLQAVKDDGLSWEQVSDLKGWHSNKAAYELLIQAIPDNFLLDPDGKILARGLRGEQLMLFLSDIFSAQ